MSEPSHLSLVLCLRVEQGVNRLAKERLDLFPWHLLENVCEPVWAALESGIAEKRELFAYFELHEGETVTWPRKVRGPDDISEHGHT